MFCACSIKQFECRHLCGCVVKQPLITHTIIDINNNPIKIALSKTSQSRCHHECKPKSHPNCYTECPYNKKLKSTASLKLDQQ